MKQLFVVGKYTQRFNELTGQSLPCGDIYQSTGLIKHVRSHHPHETTLLEHVSDVIESPDYIGKNPKEADSIELVKRIDKNVMVCVKLDKDREYLFVASVYSISDAKVKNRLNSGRFKSIDKIES